jgi:UDP-2,3-diacylglucosamine hydrolase
MAEGRIGLIAGSGAFPIAFARGAARHGLKVVCVGIEREASPELASMVEQFYCVPVYRIGRMIRCMKRHSVRRAVMAGKITKQVMHTPWRLLTLLPDWRTLHLWYILARHRKNDDALLQAVIDEFARDEILIESALTYCPELLVKPGRLTRRGPTRQERADIEFGWGLAKEMGRLDVGQSVAVMERSVLAIEAIEGTDQAILRAGEHCARGGFVVVKVAKPQQDKRFDMPAVGPTTIQSMHQAGARVLAIEAGMTIMLEQEKTITLADKYGLTVVAM